MIVKRVTTPLEETVKAEHLASLEKNRVMKICAKKKNEHMNPTLGRADSQKKKGRKKRVLDTRYKIGARETTRAQPRTPP